MYPLVMKNANDLVARQYTAWIYPQPQTDLEAGRAAGGYQLGDPSLVPLAFWPDRPYRTGMRILVAGCGTDQAAQLAFTNPAARVLGIDLSEPSLAHQQFLKEKHGLANLRLRQMDLNDSAALGEEFDLVVSTGVLHHLPDPARGMRALAAVLAPDGAMSVMVYGRHLRAGIYMLQDAFRRMGLGQSGEDVDFVRAVLASLPAWHAIHAYLRVGHDLAYPAGIVDTFLHPQDQAFTVDGVLDLVAAAGLVHQGWLDNLDYYPEGGFPAGHPLSLRVATLPERQQWAIVETMAQSLGTHRFVACRPERDPAGWRVSFEGKGFLAYVPHRRHLLELSPVAGSGEWRLTRSWHECTLAPLEGELLVAANGERSIEELLKIVPGLPAKRADRVAFARAFFRRMWRLGHVQCQIPSPA